MCRYFSSKIVWLSSLLSLVAVFEVEIVVVCLQLYIVDCQKNANNRRFVIEPAVVFLLY